MIYQLIYLSRAVESVSEKEVNDILSVARKYNPNAGVTGILMFRSGLFFQLLEGEKEAVEALYTKIEKDPRHAHMIRLFGGYNQKRIFEDWSMGYHKIEELDVKLVNEILSWNKIINQVKSIDNNILSHFIARFREHKVSDPGGTAVA